MEKIKSTFTEKVEIEKQDISVIEEFFEKMGFLRCTIKGQVK